MCTCDRDSFINFYVIIIFNMDVCFMCACLHAEYCSVCVRVFAHLVLFWTVCVCTLSVVLGVCMCAETEADTRRFHYE